MNRVNQLFEAIRQDNIKKVKKIISPSWFGLKKAYNLNIDTGKDVSNPLIFASSMGKAEIVNLLLDSSVDVNCQDSYGDSALMKAVSYGHTKIVEMLIHKGADVNMQNKSGDTALLLATRFNYTEIISLLTLHHAEINVICHEFLKGDTPLTIAVKNRNNEVANMFISKGADVNAKNEYGETALFIAVEKLDVEMAKILINAGADIDTDDRTNPLRYAISYGKDEGIEFELVKLLINKNNINKPYNNGDLPVKQALNLGHTKIADWLIANGAIISGEERESIELKRKQEEELVRLGYFCERCGYHKSEQEVEEDSYDEDEWVTIYYLRCRICGSKITDMQGNRIITRVRN